MTRVRITYRPSHTVLAEGPLGWGITPFEGNFYIRRKYLRTTGLRVNWIPGICVYKFLYVGLDLTLPSGERIRGIGWRYWLPNPLFPFIAFRAAFSGYDTDLQIERISIGYKENK